MQTSIRSNFKKLKATRTAAAAATATAVMAAQQQQITAATAAAETGKHVQNKATGQWDDLHLHPIIMCGHVFWEILLPLPPSVDSHTAYSTFIHLYTLMYKITCV